MTRPFRLAIISTHPIQYHAPWFRGLAAHPDLDIHVYFCHKATPLEQARSGFGVEFDWDVDLLMGYPHSFLQNVAKPAGHGRFGGFDTPEITKIIREGEYDALLVNGWNYKSAWQAIWAARQRGVKVLVRSDSHLHTQRSIGKRAAKQLVYRRFIPRFDACLAVGQWSREYFLHYGASSDRVFLVPHVVEIDPDRVGDGGVDTTRWRFRDASALDQDAVTFLFCGKFIAKKRPMDFVRALTSAVEQGNTIQGLMVGDGPLRQACEEFAREKKAPIRFAGFLNQSKIWGAYLACDVLVLPSDGGETWGLVVNEAMACGRPCIVSDCVGSGPDMIRPWTTGLTYPVGDVETLARVIKDFSLDRPRLAHMSKMASAMARKYSVQSAVDGVLECLAASLKREEAFCAR